jgi:hypothetical protein
MMGVFCSSGRSKECGNDEKQLHDAFGLRESGICDLFQSVKWIDLVIEASEAY